MVKHKTYYLRFKQAQKSYILKNRYKINYKDQAAELGINLNTLLSWVRDYLSYRKKVRMFIRITEGKYKNLSSRGAARFEWLCGRHSGSVYGLMPIVDHQPRKAGEWYGYTTKPDWQKGFDGFKKMTFDEAAKGGNIGKAAAQEFVDQGWIEPKPVRVIPPTAKDHKITNLNDAIDYTLDHAEEGLEWLRSWREGEALAMFELENFQKSQRDR